MKKALVLLFIATTPALAQSDPSALPACFQILGNQVVQSNLNQNSNAKQVEELTKQVEDLSTELVKLKGSPTEKEK